MVKAYSYSRYSSAAQHDNDSLRRQLKGCFEWAEKRGLELDTTHHDPAVSGYSGINRIRGALGSFLLKVESGEIERGSYLIVDSLDRLSRENETRVLNMLTNLTLAGIKVVNVVENHVLDENADMVDYMRVLIHAARSHQESKEKGRKVAEAHGESKRLAREEGRVWHRSGPSWLAYNEETGKFDWLPEKVAIVRRIFDLMDEGKSSAAVAKLFNDEGVPSMRGSKWWHSGVLEIARNRAVLGEYQPKLAKGGDRAARRPHDGDPIEGYYGKPIVSLEQFARVQAGLQSRLSGGPRRRGNSAKEFNNLFAGLTVCNACGGAVGFHKGSVTKGKAWRRSSVLRCGNVARGLCTAKARLRYDDIEAAVLRHVTEYAVPAEGRAKPRHDLLTAAIAKRDDLKRKVANLLDLLEDGDANLRARYSQRVAELDAAEKAVKVLKAQQLPTDVIPLKTRQEAISRLLQRLETAEGQERYQLRAQVAQALRTVVEWIECYLGEDESYVMVRMMGDERMYMVIQDVPVPLVMDAKGTRSSAA